VRYRQLGNSGLTVSVLGLGGNNFGGRCDQRETCAIVSAAIEAGITFFDTAEVYGENGGSERILGEALKGRRDKVVLATKFGHRRQPPDNAPGSRRNVRRAVEASLKRLQTDYIDLYYLHHPDTVTPIQETLAALHELVYEGKVRYIACSQLAAWQIVEAEWTARTEHLSRFIACQDHYSLLERSVEDEVIPACRQYGIGFVPYYPLAHGLLTGKYRRGEPPPPGTRLASRFIPYSSPTHPFLTGKYEHSGHAEEDAAGGASSGILTDAAFDRVEALERYAQERGLSLLQVAIAGLAAQPGVSSVIAGATRPEQVTANAAAAAWAPSAEDLAALNALG
jgi:aryl-alcohol dehydrogenase-like predicted oxidoreductase